MQGAVNIDDIDLLVWIGGDYGRVGESVERTLYIIREQFAGWHVTLLIDGPEWDHRVPQIPCGRRICLPHAASLPATAFSEALSTSTQRWSAFAWPGSEPDAQAILQLREHASDADLIYAEGILPIPEGIGHPMQHGRLQMFEAIPMERSLVATQAASFDGSPLLQRFFWENFVIRLSRHGMIASRACGASPQVALPWSEFPFEHPVSTDADLAGRYTNCGNDLQSLVNDLEGSTQGPGWPIRVLVLGGIFEPHHNELCFYRCFERLKGQGYLTWRAMLYERCRVEDLSRNDVVIFTRPRYPGCAELIDAAKARNIGTIVMIDDNWIALGRDNERYRPLFGPGQPAIETFLHCVGQADATILYNHALAEDIAFAARKIIELTPFVDPAAYQCSDPIARDELLVGYAGSQRPDNSAFRALAALAERHPEVKILFMGAPLPPELVSIEPSRIVWAPFQISYEGYTQRIARLHPDILLAPLDESRASASKAPNKYLEISILGAAGIFSRVAPYTSYVREGETGLFADSDEHDWEDALQRLYGDRDLLQSIATAARRHVLAHHTLDQAIPELLHVFSEVRR